MERLCCVVGVNPSPAGSSLAVSSSLVVVTLDDVCDSRRTVDGRLDVSLGFLQRPQVFYVSGCWVATGPDHVWNQTPKKTEESFVDQ